MILAIGSVTGQDGDAGSTAVWRSSDGFGWERLDTSDLADTEFIEIVWDGRDFVAMDRDRSLWRSRSGDEWGQQRTSGLERSDDYQVQSIADLAASGQDLLVVEYRELMDTNDDGDLALHRSTDGGATWQATGTEGLETLFEQNPNMPVVPAVGARAGGFVLSAEGFDSEATLWGSSDGNNWGEGYGLGGPPLVFRDVDQVVVNGEQIIALSLGEEGLIAWRATG